MIKRLQLFAAALALAPATAAGLASAQAVSAPPAWAASGYHGAASSVSQTFDPSTRDANGNRTVVNGEIQPSGATSVATQFSSLTSGPGAGGSGAGYASATAIGNLLNVSVTGSWNTVVVNSTQTNTGKVQASAALNDQGGQSVSH